ncbi:MAG: hypothetical protein HRU20_28850 [Pseudomonadales bacterium]|nr:hypothetical protein [Pseudomonadales bacterium]
MLDTYFDEDMRLDIVQELRNHATLKFSKQRGKMLRDGTCPGSDCGRKDAYINTESPGAVKCGSEGKGCGKVFPVTELFPWLFENLSERYPATNENPNATADQYMKGRRGFDISRLKGWYTQGRLKLPNDVWDDTVRFYLNEKKTEYWERMINNSALKVINPKTGKPVPKGNFSYKYTYSEGKYWAPPGQTIVAGNEVFIVEGIFHAIAMHLAGYKVVAAFSCTNLPRLLINEYKGQNITWNLAYDDEPGAHKHIRKYIKQLKQDNENFDIYLTGSKGVDWDDAARQDKLNDKYLEQCYFRGQLFRAESEEQYALNFWLQNEFPYFVFPFRNRLYSANINITELQTSLKKKDLEHPGLEDFNSHAKVIEISNCYPQFLYIERDELTHDQKYCFNVTFSDSRGTNQAALEPSAINDPRNFSNALLNKTGGGLFEGTAGDMRTLRKLWLNYNVDYVEAIDFIGYHKHSQAYIFNNFAVHQGKVIEVNAQGYFAIDDLRLKTSLKHINIISDGDCNTDWYPDFMECFGYNGFATLAFFIASLFTRQIKIKMGSFPILEVTGDREAGKSTLIRFIWKLLGRNNYEGFDMLEASRSGGNRELAQVSNLPVVILESDREQMDADGRSTKTSKSINWDTYKKITDLDGVISIRGVNNNGNDTKTPIFQASLCISQNDTVNGSEALLSRIVHLHCTTAHKKVENIPKADHLKQLKAEDIGGFLIHAISHEKEFLEHFFEVVETYRKRIRKDAKISSERIVDFHAQVMAAGDALSTLLPVTQVQKDTLYTHMLSRAHSRQGRLNKDHPMLEQFWDIYHYLNQDFIEVNDETGTHRKEVERLNHATDPKLIAINLNQVEEMAGTHKQKLPPMSLIKQHLPTSQRHKFHANKKAHSKLFKATINVWIFEK